MEQMRETKLGTEERRTTELSRVKERINDETVR
jgi:hypothetical protein